MNRRDVLRYIGALGVSASPYLAQASSSTNSILGKKICDRTGAVVANAERQRSPRIGLIGVGGAGCSILTQLDGQLPWLERSVAIDPSSISLRQTNADTHICLTKCGERPTAHQTAVALAHSAVSAIEQSITGMDIVFILADLGGVVGSGIAPIVANIAHEARIISVGVAIKPFEWEVQHRIEIASDASLAMLNSGLDTLFLLDNDEFSRPEGEDTDTPIQAALNLQSRKIASIYQSILMPVVEPGLVAFDFEDMRHILSRPGYSVCAVTTAQGNDAAMDALTEAICKPWMGPKRLLSASALLAHIEANGSDLSPRSVAETSRFLHSPGIGDTEVFVTASAVDMPRGTYRVSLLASGIRL